MKKSVYLFIVILAVVFLVAWLFSDLFSTPAAPPVAVISAIQPPAPVAPPVVQPAQLPLPEAAKPAPYRPPEPPVAPADIYYIRMLQDLRSPSDNRYAQVFQDGKDAGAGVVLRDFLAEMVKFTYPTATRVDMLLDVDSADLADPDLRQRRMHYWDGYFIMLRPRLKSYSMEFKGCDTRACHVSVRIPKLKAGTDELLVAKKADFNSSPPYNGPDDEDGDGDESP